MSQQYLVKRISDLSPGNYETDKSKAFLPASMGGEETFKYPLDAMEKAVSKKIDELKDEMGCKLPNTTQSSESTGVTEQGSISVKGTARLDLDGITNLTGVGGGAISGLNGWLGLPTWPGYMSQGVRVYIADSDIDLMNVDMSGFSIGDLFFFVASGRIRTAWLRYYSFELKGALDLSPKETYRGLGCQACYILLYVGIVDDKPMFAVVGFAS